MVRFCLFCCFVLIVRWLFFSNFLLEKIEILKFKSFFLFFWWLSGNSWFVLVACMHAFVWAKWKTEFCLTNIPLWSANFIKFCGPKTRNHHGSIRCLLRWYSGRVKWWRFIEFKVSFKVEVCFRAFPWSFKACQFLKWQVFGFLSIF